MSIQKPGFYMYTKILKDPPKKTYIKKIFPERFSYKAIDFICQYKYVVINQCKLRISKKHVVCELHL